MALFGEKYDDLCASSRSMTSRELCGGTHVGATSELGIFKILSETSVGANVRIEGVTGRAAVGHYRERDQMVAQAAAALGTNENEFLSALNKLQARVAGLEAEVKGFLSQTCKDLLPSLVESATRHGDVAVVADVVAARDMDHLLSLVDQVRDRLQPVVVVLGAELQGKGALVVSRSRSILLSMAERW